MKFNTKSFTISLISLALISSVGYGIAFGYGGGGSVSWGPGGYVPSIVNAPAITSAPVGQVLGVSTFNFNSNLGVGSSGDDVTQLQTRLTSEGFYSGPITGTFGPLTLSAVKAYQASKGLPQTGYVGSLTRTSLNNSTATTNNSSNTSSVSQMTLSQFVQFLINIGAIAADKLANAKKLIGM